MNGKVGEIVPIVISFLSLTVRFSSTIMPSVRIRDPAFLQAGRDDNPAAIQTTQPQNNQSTQDDPTPRRSLIRPHIHTMPTLRNNRLASTSPPLRPQRGRSGSSASRVHDHCVRSSARYSATDRSSSITALPLLSSSLDYADGPLSTSTGSPTIHHTNADSIRATYGSEMHHDDVIEHLDVIGK